MSCPLLRLTRAAQSVEAGELTPTQAGALKETKGSDEISQLSQVFGRMAQEVILREQKLRQEVELLRIEIDQAKKERQVAEITETDYFQELKVKAKKMRSRSEDD